MRMGHRQSDEYISERKKAARELDELLKDGTQNELGEWLLSHKEHVQAALEGRPLRILPTLDGSGSMKVADELWQSIKHADDTVALQLIQKVLLDARKEGRDDMRLDPQETY
jgi:CRISPR/Cas system endoribonuclease Cas6 (RAMP superfamily)